MRNSLDSCGSEFHLIDWTSSEASEESKESGRNHSVDFSEEWSEESSIFEVICHLNDYESTRESEVISDKIPATFLYRL